MSLEARRKNKANAATAQHSAPAANSEKKTAKAKTAKSQPRGNPVKGPMRGIALGRAYKEWDPILIENGPGTGSPVPRSYYDPAAHHAKSIGKDVRTDRVLNPSAFISHLNAEVFKPIFGVALRGKIARMLVEGIADQVLLLVERGVKVKFPNLVVLQKSKRAARKARNPRTGDAVHVPARTTLSAKPARSAKVYLQQAGA